ncbi:MAG: SAM-dependent methyltransferase [Planctomycetota bacterium]
MPTRPQFIFITCQVGAAAAVKAEIAARWPEFRFSFSRPGLLTFKLPEDHRLPADFSLGATFARAYGFSLGQIRGESTEAMAAEAWQLLGGRPVQRIHVWPRDRAEPGYRGFEPALNDESAAVHALLQRTCPAPGQIAADATDPAAPAARGEDVLDCVLVEPGSWWIGFHRTRGWASCHPGGMLHLALPADAVSRAWLKMEEALRWSQLPLAAGARVAEIGSAPGGASQALLARGYMVTGIDPAEMDPVVLGHPNFLHIRRRSTQVRRRDFRKIRWLAADMNVAPNYTLDAVEAIVQHPEISIRGMLLTLKLIDWSMAEKMPEYLARIRSWGYNVVRARQLQHNRRELCVAALQRPFLRKS